MHAHANARTRKCTHAPPGRTPPLSHANWPETTETKLVYLETGGSERRGRAVLGGPLTTQLSPRGAPAPPPLSLLLSQHVSLLGQFVSNCQTRAHSQALEGGPPSCDITARSPRNSFKSFFWDETTSVTQLKKGLNDVMCYST